MSPSTFLEPRSSWPTALGALVGAVTGTVVPIRIGTGQWLTLRRHVPHAARWIAYTAAGWGAGLLVLTVAATPL